MVLPVINGGGGSLADIDMYISSWDANFDTTNLTPTSTKLDTTLNLLGNPAIKRISGEVRYGLQIELNNNPVIYTFNEDTDSFGNVSLLINQLDQDKDITVTLIGYDKPVGQTATRQSGNQYVVFHVPAIDANLLGNLNDQTFLDDVNNDTSITINNEIQISRSLFTISTDLNDTSTISGAVKDSKVQIPASFLTPQYYQFGTNIIFQPVTVESRQSGGIGIFTNSTMNTGYFILLKTTQAAVESSLTDDTFQIIKVKGGIKKNLKITQKYKLNTLAGIYAGTQYKIDIKVKVVDTGLLDKKGNKKYKTTIRAYVNGMLMEVIDENSGEDPNQNALTPTSNLALFTNIGTTSFDYVYALKDSDGSYFNRPNSYDIYNEKFASSIIKFAYGDIFVSGVIPELDSNTPVKYIEEFGPTAREIKYIKNQHELPGEASYTWFNRNTNIKELSYSGTEFESELYLINVASISIEMNSETATHLSILGKYLDKINQIEYEDETLKNTITEEPYIYESNWLQTQRDAVNLSNFIKDKFSKARKILKLEIFANPLIQIGDIISVSYTYQGLSGTEKFVIVSIENQWQEGLTTTITARSIDS